MRSQFNIRDNNIGLNLMFKHPTLDWRASSLIWFFFFICFWRTSRSFFLIFSSVVPHRSQHTAKCHPMWQPTRKLAVSCELGRHQIRTRDCRTAARHATTEPPRLPTEPPCLPELSLTWCRRTDWTFDQHLIPELFYISSSTIGIFPYPVLCSCKMNMDMIIGTFERKIVDLRSHIDWFWKFLMSNLLYIFPYETWPLY